ncbi:hypothetical protein Syun_020706 [Stephania yunnanensis]|uniref:Uncharacterized protein n=1 Tax=Stephania yunnanensis TaxID=152371 RepID=A0AAP0IE96_9MAGN
MKKKNVHLQVVVCDRTLISCRLVHLLKCSGSSPPCVPSQSTKTHLHSPSLCAKSSTDSIEFGFGFFFVPPPIHSFFDESGFDSIGHYVAAIGRVSGEFGFDFFDHSSLVMFWDK